MGLQTEVTVHQRVVEAEVLKPGLQGGHVVAVHRSPELVQQRPCAEPVGGFPERAVGGFADDSVDDQTATLLKGAHRIVEVDVEHVGSHVPSGGEILVGTVQQAQRGQRCPDLHHGAAAVTAAQQVTRAGTVPRGIVPGAVVKTRHTRPFGDRRSAVIRRRQLQTG